MRYHHKGVFPRQVRVDEQRVQATRRRLYPRNRDFAFDVMLRVCAKHRRQYGQET